MFSRILLVALVTSTLVGRAGETPMFKILTVDPGMYRVGFEELTSAGLKEKSLPSQALALSSSGEPVPILVEDGGDGQFGPGDHFEFRAHTLHGDLGYYHEYTQTSTYWLELDAEKAPRIRIAERAEPARSLLPFKGRGPAFRTSQHLETDTLLMRFRSPQHEPHEIWYWQKLACNDSQPFAIPVHTPDLDRIAGGKVHLKLGFRGWSRYSGSKTVEDHQIRVLLNGEVIHESQWSGKDVHTIDVKDTPAGKWREGENLLEMMIPSRHDPKGSLIVDVTLLNWVEIDYPKKSVYHAAQNPVYHIAPAHANQPFHLVAPSQDRVFLFGDNGLRWELPPAKGNQDPIVIHHLPHEAAESSFLAVAEDNFLKPRAILQSQPNDLRDPGHPVDYIMISHPSLMEASRPLAAFHRSQGLAVKQVDIRDVYDSFNHGILHPKAIKKFLAHAYRHWPRPAPRFVLLIGDASWDTKNAMVIDENYPDLTYYPRFRTEFNKILSTAYKDTEKNNRNLIPTMTFYDNTGHSASDIAFVCVDGDDYRPDMAIGRLPVTEPAEVTDIVSKTIAYIEDSKVGPWRRNILYITNEEERFQSQTTEIAKNMSNKGMISQRIYPASSEKSNEKHTRLILDSLDQGQYLVYFLGHGGRYIWRTGPPDFRKNHDLFTLDDLDKLQANPRLPIVVSLTCYSAPFDHPGADSIGEKFLRLSKKGAVAFYGASWRNWPNNRMVVATMDALIQAETIGEAIQASKQDLISETLMQTYNLLGDPAIPLRKPPKPLAIDLVHDGNRWMARVKTDLQEGRGLLEVLNEVGEPLANLDFTIEKATFELDVPKYDGEGSRIQIYLWNKETAQDALGQTPLPSSSAKIPEGKPSRP